ncbi:aldo/keto reductase [Pseudactinotalea terrae]|uniref:aldo/keto reductase n=1 Tax=Pseudactinotalea terrae TaxID=1743262 RepID=UPI0012E210EC|nr:aldo/keto reductase [Pseudactinotalea terrae]
MELRRLGRTGLRVSAVGLGTMTWGRDTDEHEAAEQLKVFLDAGGSLIDTAATYSDGGALDIISSLLRDEVHRDDVVLAARSGVADGRVDASRRALLSSLDETLRRLGTDHLDLWLVQAPDPGTPVAETADTLAHAVGSGKVRYVGLANHAAWQVAQMATLLDGGVGLACTQTEISLLNRSSEHELIAASDALGVGVIGWSPLGRGVLSAKYRHSVPADSRAASPHLRGFVEPYLTASARSVVEAVATAADGLGRAPVEVALAWARDAPGVSSVVVGARTPAQLRGALAATDLDLPDEIRGALDEVTQAIAGG